MPSVYLETSIVSYLRERPSDQIIAAARRFTQGGGGIVIANATNYLFRVLF